MMRIFDVKKLDFLQVKQLKRKRKSNYSVRETQTLIKEIHKRKDVLFSRQQNTAVNELKRQAWEEVAQSVNALGEGELRTAAEVKRRYLDWRALTKKKQLKAELALSSPSSSMAMKIEYDQSSSEQEAVSLGSSCDQLLDLSGFPKDCQCDWPELAGLSEASAVQSELELRSVKMEDDISDYRLDGDAVDGDVDEDDIPSILSEIESHGDGHSGDVYPHNDLGMLSSSKDRTSTTNRDLLLAGGLITHGLGGHADQESVGSGFLAIVEKQRLELEKQRLAVETERLAVEKERLAVEKERLLQVEVERERLHLERERLQVEKERLRLVQINQQEHVNSSINLPPQQGPPSSSTSLSSNHDAQEERRTKGWTPVVDLETEKINLEKERLQLEKERLQFFKFEAGRLQIERERLQVEKERMQMHKDHHSVKA